MHSAKRGGGYRDETAISLRETKSDVVSPQRCVARNEVGRRFAQPLGWTHKRDFVATKRSRTLFRTAPALFREAEPTKLDIHTVDTEDVRTSDAVATSTQIMPCDTRRVRIPDATRVRRRDRTLAECRTDRVRPNHERWCWMYSRSRLSRDLALRRRDLSRQ